MSWLRRRGHEAEPAGQWRQPNLEEVSSVLQNSLKQVSEAVRNCSSAEDTALAGARRDLAGALSESLSRLEGLGRDVAPTSRIHGMARLTAVELVTMARQHLTFDFVITDQLSLAEISGLVRATGQP